MAGTNILVRQKDLIAGSGISITPDTTSGNVTIAATNTAIDEARLLPTGGKNGNILEYQEGADRGNGNDVRLLLQSALTDSASGNAAPAAVTTQGVTLTGDNSLLFSGNDSHVTAVLATDEIFAADKEWTIDFWMKPTANSSEWNYILTENTGDWGSHSIGLTWNKSKSVLEQDTGGYVASVIKAPNWPNNSIACAVGEWHFVAVEKQKTATGWSLNYYLNGAIWLQVAFTGEFVPFTSDNPFWFGGKTTDSGRWFKGEANKLRVTAGARYGGKAFAVPDRLIDYAAPAGQPVWTEGINHSRLLPENPANGDIPCYSDEPPEGVNYNDANTVLLLQGSSDNTAAASTSERLNGIVTGEFPVQSDGSLLVTGSSNYITFNDADTRRVFSGEFTLETYIKTTQFTSSGARHDTNWCVVYRNDTSSVTQYQWLLLSDFYADAGKFGIWPYPQMSGETFPKTLVNAEFQHVAIDVYMVDGVRKFTMYRNGVPYHTGNYWSTTPADWSSGVSAAMRLFGEGPSGGDDYLSNASVMSLRVSNVARYKGVSFDPPADGKYLNPPAGYWGKLSKNELVQSVNGITPDENGNVTVETGSTVDESRLLKVPTSADEGKLPVIRADKIPAVYHDTTLAAIVIEGDKVIDKISGKELIKVGNPQIVGGGIHSPTNSDYYMLELEGVEGLPVAVSFDYQGDESPDSSNIVTINGTCAYYSINGVSFCRSQGGGNNIKIDNQPVGVSEAYRNYVMQVSSDNYESKTPPVAFIAGESKSPTYEGSFPSMSPLSSVKVCGRFGKIKNILISSAFPYTGNFTPRGDGVEGFGVPEKREPGWNYETLDEAANGRLLPANPANGDIPCFDATATIGGGNDETVKFLLQPATTDGELIDSAAGAVTPATITNHSLTVSESGEIEFSSSKYATVPASGILADVLRHDKPWVFDLLVYLDQTSSQSRFFGTESGGDFFCQWTGDYGFDFKYGDTWISTLTGNVGEWNLLTLEYYQKNGTWHVALYLQGVLCQDKEISTSFDPKTSELAIGRSTSGSHLCSGKIRAIRIREGALYNGQSFTPDEFPYQEPQTVGEWGKLNKSALVQNVNGQTPDSSGAVTLPEATTSAAGLMSATDREKSIGLTTRGFYPNALAKSGAVDFNEIIDHGFYFIGGDTPHLNYPETYQQNGGTFQVIRNGNYLTQTFIPLNINTVFIRTCVNALSDSSVRTFSAWRRALTAPDITESMADPGYFKLPNGTIAQYGGQHVSRSTNTIQLPITVATISYQHVSVWGDNSDLEALDTLPMVVLVEPGVSPISSLTAVTKTADGSTWGGYITWLVIGTV